MTELADKAPLVFVFVALSPEAKPLIRAWKLKKDTGAHAVEIYRNRDKAVIVSGVGKVAMAGAVAYTMARFKPLQPIVINIGIAGHAFAKLGDLYLAHSVMDADTGRCFYPQMPFEVSLPTKAVSTISKPTDTYEGDRLYEMEAAGFFEIAMKFTTAELTQSLKIVSDGRQSPWQNITPQDVETWIDNCLPSINDVIATLSAIPVNHVASFAEALYSDLTTRYHFSITSSTKLRGLLTQWQVLMNETALALPNSQFADANALIKWLEDHVSGQTFNL